LAIAVSALVASPARAGSDDPPAKGQLLRGPPGDAKRLTREQIRNCMRLAVEISAREKTLEAPAQHLEERRSALQAQSEALENAKPKLDRRSKQAVAEFNKKVAALNAVQREFNASVDNLNLARQKSQPQVQAYNVDCAGRPYSPDDEAAVRAELGLKD